MPGMQGRVCVITGASSGIGRQTALDLAAAGARVCVAARREDRLRAVVDEMGGLAGGHSFWTTDISRRDQVQALADHVAATYGRCDVLINNAGFSRERNLGEEGAVEDLEAVMETNFLGIVWTTAAFLPLLKASSPSHVVNVASVAGRLAAGGAAYCASKFAVVGWSESLHFQLRDQGVFVSLVEPGIIPTEGFPATVVERSRLLRHTTGSPHDVSKAIQDAIAHRRFQRTVPRWYYLLQIPRVLMPPVYRYVQRRFVGPIYRRNQAES